MNRGGGDLWDRTLVGAGFGALAGFTALLLVMLLSLVWSPLRAGVLTILGLVLVYAAAGAGIGAAWPVRRGRTGRWALWLVAAIPVSLTVVAAQYGPPGIWPRRVWLWLPLVIPAFAWVLGSGSRRR